jgi:hypothetical protein
MAETRRIRKLFKSRPTLEGAGVRLKRALEKLHAGTFIKGAQNKQEEGET